MHWSHNSNVLGQFKILKPYFLIDSKEKSLPIVKAVGS